LNKHINLHKNLKKYLVYKRNVFILFLNVDIMRLSKLLDKIKEYNHQTNLDLIRKAYKFSRELHKDKKRASGEPYIQHPLNVAYILAEHKLDDDSIIAALLHDLVEDTSISLDEIKKEFGEEIASLVDGLTKLTQIKYETKRNVEYIRKMLVSSTKDVRIILIKLADKLHNMRTVKYLEENKIKRVCRETLYVYAPLAHKLGMASIKDELEDLAFKHLHPTMYQKFKEKFGRRKMSRENEIKKIISIIDKRLKEQGINALILGRAKHFYSVYKKMIEKNRSFEEIYDLIGLRIITDTVKECYEALGIIHNLWTPIPGEFDDYIAMPKPNMYQSLHTAVVAFNQSVEFQIRTYEMDKLAEEGIAIHWSYKGVKEDRQFDKRLNLLKQILSLQSESKNVKEFMEFLKDVFEDEIYIFTPKGDIINLPKGSCPIDFAYAIHSSVGDRCNGAIVNGRIVPLRHQLKSGDMVNILTSKNPSPKRDWLKIVNTAKARNRIKQFISSHEEIPLPKLDNKQKPILTKQRSTLVNVNKKPIYNYRLAKDCNPTPRQKIIAQLSKNRYTIHKQSCSNIERRKSIGASWADISFPLVIKIISKDRVGLLADILNTIAATGTNVNLTRSRKMSNNYVGIELGVTPENLDHIRDLLSKIKNIKSVGKISIDKK
tara:strand:- start:4322 stop:6301 length:1980 start_codon:yes stop_codon:yes gene_type:complete